MLPSTVVSSMSLIFTNDYNLQATNVFYYLIVLEKKSYLIDFRIIMYT